MNLRVAAAIALLMWLGAQPLDAYRGFGGIVTGWQLTAELTAIGWKVVSHPVEAHQTLFGPDSFGRTLLILSWSGIAANLALLAAIGLGMLQRTVPAFVAAAVAAGVAVLLLVVLAWDGAVDLKVGCGLWTASIMWMLAAAAFCLRQERRRVRQ